MSMQWGDQTPDEMEEESWADVIGAVVGCAVCVVLMVLVVVMLG